MACRVFTKSYFVVYGNHCCRVGTLHGRTSGLAKWSSHALPLASATTWKGASVSCPQRPLSTNTSKSNTTVSSVADSLSTFMSPVRQSDSLGIVRSACFHAQQPAWAHHYLNRQCYSTQPQKDGTDSTPTSTTTMADTADTATQAEGQLTQKERLKRAVKEYGSTVIVFHITISLASLGGFYLAVTSGIDMVGILKSLGVGESILQSRLATGTGTFVVAYAVHKVFAPARIAITLTCTPLIVRYLRSRGVLKPPKAKAKA